MPGRKNVVSKLGTDDFVELIESEKTRVGQFGKVSPSFLLLIKAENPFPEMNLELFWKNFKNANSKPIFSRLEISLNNRCCR
jgi:hypothetical protein